MVSKACTVVGLGELLWDLFPAGKKLGGAPANFAYIASLLGERGIPASRLGNDPLGDEAIQRLGEIGLSTEFVQRDAEHATSTVEVEVDTAGQARFRLSESIAWDFFDWNAQWKKLAEETDAVCFGSLAQRAERSRGTIRNFILGTRPNAVRVFDVNLRQHFYSAEVIGSSMELATIVKLNHEELPRVMKLLGLEHRGEKESVRRLLDEYQLKLACLTRGTDGSLLVSATECCEHPGFRVNVVDTVGAGDAFTATMVHGYLRGITLTEINAEANRVGAWVASQAGGTPAPEAGGLKESLARIG
jgi:fructokinase